MLSGNVKLNTVHILIWLIAFYNLKKTNYNETEFRFFKTFFYFFKNVVVVVVVVILPPVLST
jgi:hypothetical protein